MISIDNAINSIRLASEISERRFNRPLIVKSSGGKDSGVIVQLALDSGVSFVIEHNLTTIDAPESVDFVRSEASRLASLGVDFIIKQPKLSMWDLIVREGMPPTRLVRYCSRELKMKNEKDTFMCTGVRRAESRSRQNRSLFERIASSPKNRTNHDFLQGAESTLFKNSRLHGPAVVNPIIDWTDDDVYAFTKDRGIPLNPLYGDGFCRVGCIGCPMGSRAQREAQFERYPQFKAKYIDAFDRMLARRKELGRLISPDWGSGQQVFDWWITGKKLYYLEEP